MVQNGTSVISFGDLLALMERLKNMWKEFTNVFHTGTSNFLDAFGTKVFEEKLEETNRNFRDTTTIPRALQ